MSNIHLQAIIESGAKIGKNVTIEPFAVIKSGVILRDNVVIKSHVYIDGNTEIGEGSVIWPGASIGTKAQDLKYRGEKTYVKIGKNCEIREFATINSSCQENSILRVGDNCLIMAYCHIAHNCTIGKGVIMSNSSNLAGHVVVEDYAIIGGMTPVHQFSRIGKYAMVGGFSGVSRDVPPFTIGSGHPYKVGGLNIIGLKRHKFSLEVRQHLAKAFKFTYRMNLRMEDALECIKNEVKLIPEVQYWVDFCNSSKRGLIGLEGITKTKKEELQNCLS
jgi:UDP-N-acetylglucosamine acyltransferase